jgi:hypothetical protein
MKQLNLQNMLKIVDYRAMKSENSDPQLSKTLGNTHAP